MDNLTHSLIGLIAGDALSRTAPVSEHGLTAETRRGLFMAATIVGGNLPDIDLLYSYRGPSTDKLAYLLGHRGYTHTIIGCLALSLLLYGSIELWLRRRRLIASGADRVALLGITLVGAGLHLSMDALNSYGVHPFWPFQNRWVYGDSVYIVEPLYWAATAPLIFLMRARVARAILACVLLAAIVASLMSGQVPLRISVGLTAFIGVMLLIGWRVRARTALLVAAIAFLIITSSFIFAGQIAARQAEALVRAEFPSARSIDHVLTPMPVDPLCWDVLMLQSMGDRYVSRHATLSIAPTLIPAERCAGTSLDRQTLVPQTLPTVRDAQAIRWKTFSMPTATLAELVASDCDAAALMRFARAPFAMAVGADWLLGDLRFDRGPKPGFSDIRIRESTTAAAQCPWTPPWEPPRKDLLEMVGRVGIEPTTN